MQVYHANLIPFSIKFLNNEISEQKNKMFTPIFGINMVQKVAIASKVISKSNFYNMKV